MTSTAILYCPISMVSADMVRRTSLLYDRVIVPLPDCIRSGKISWLGDLAHHCEYTRGYISRFHCEIGDDSEYSRPLSIDDYKGLASGSNIFRDEFFDYVNNEFGNNEWRQLVKSATDVAQDILNFYIAKDLIETEGYKNIIFPVSRNLDSPNMIRKIAEILEIESVKCALKGFDLPMTREAFDKVRRVSRSLDSRVSLQRMLVRKSREIKDAYQLEPDNDTRRAILREAALDIAVAYNHFIDELERYSRDGLRIKKSSNNSLLIMHEMVRSNKRGADLVVGQVSVLGIKLGGIKIKFNLHEYEAHYNGLLKQHDEIANLSSVDTKWQIDLLCLRCELDKEFGELETYKRVMRGRLLSTSFFEYVKKLLGV